MGKHTGLKVFALMLLIIGVSAGGFFIIRSGILLPPPEEEQYGFSLQLEFFLTDKYDETPTTANLEGIEVKISLCSGPSGSNLLFRETATSAASGAGRVRTSQTYASGQWICMQVNGASGAQSYGNASVIVQIPYYSSSYPPTYHYLDIVLSDQTIQLEYLPTLLPRGYQSTGALFSNGFDTDISAADYDISGNGTLTTMKFEVYNTVDETGLNSWFDYDENYLRQSVFVLYIPRLKDGTNAATGQDGALITASSIPLFCAKQPTTGQDGVFVCAISDDAVDVDKDQSSGLYHKRNSFEIEITWDFSSCGGSANFTICFSIWRDTDLYNWQNAGLDTDADTEMYTHTSYYLAVTA